MHATEHVPNQSTARLRIRNAMKRLLCACVSSTTQDENSLRELAYNKTNSAVRFRQDVEEISVSNDENTETIASNDVFSLAPSIPASRRMPSIYRKLSGGNRMNGQQNTSTDTVENITKTFELNSRTILSTIAVILCVVLSWFIWNRIRAYVWMPRKEIVQVALLTVVVGTASVVTRNHVNMFIGTCDCKDIRRYKKLNRRRQTRDPFNYSVQFKEEQEQENTFNKSMTMEFKEILAVFFKIFVVCTGFGLLVYFCFHLIDAIVRRFTPPYDRDEIITIFVIIGLIMATFAGLVFVWNQWIAVDIHAPVIAVTAPAANIEMTSRNQADDSNNSMSEMNGSVFLQSSTGSTERLSPSLQNLLIPG